MTVKPRGRELSYVRDRDGTGREIEGDCQNPRYLHFLYFFEVGY